MTQEVKDALNFLSTLTPVNIHIKTNATLNHRLDFESLWNKHGPQAARYGLLARYMEGKITAL
jgi:hypothetical protein